MGFRCLLVFWGQKRSTPSPSSDTWRFKPHLICLSAIYLAPCTSSVCVFKASECRSLQISPSVLDLGFQSIQRPLEDLWKTHHTEIERILVCFWYRCHLSLTPEIPHTGLVLSFPPICSSHLISLCLIFTLITFCRLHRTHTVWFTTHTHTHTHTHTVSVSQISCFLSSWCQLYFKLLKPYLKAFYLCEISDWNWMFNEIKCRQRLEFIHWELTVRW